MNKIYPKPSPKYWCEYKIERTGEIKTSKKCYSEDELCSWMTGIDSAETSSIRYQVFYKQIPASSYWQQQRGVTTSRNLYNNEGR